MPKKLDPTDLLLQQAHRGHNGCLEVSNGSVVWFFYIENSQLIYATHSLDPAGRLDSHLRRLSQQVPMLTSEIRAKIRLRVELDAAKPNYLRPDYQAIWSLVDRQYLKLTEATTLAAMLSRETLESFLPLQEGTYQFKQVDGQRVLRPLDLNKFLQQCQTRLRAWQSLGAQVWSPYQRPILVDPGKLEQRSSAEHAQKLGKILKGLNFRQLALFLNQDELKLAQSWHPLIADKIIQLREPLPPYDQLPKPSNLLATTISIKASKSQRNRQAKNSINPNKKSSVPKPKYTIACIDDSPSILKTVRRFLDHEDLSVVLIDNPVKALVKLMRSKPDLILLDVSMPQIDGYELCLMIRKHDQLKQVPVVMVTGNKGMLNQSKSKVVGATDYMAKPFTQSQLSNMVFRHLQEIAA